MSEPFLPDHCTTCEKMASDRDDEAYKGPDRFGVLGEGRKDPDPELLTSLPLELREMIYEMVYGDTREVRTLSRRSFEKDEMRRKRTMRRSFKPKSFTESFFYEMVVNKQYLEEAARVWFRTKTFIWDSAFSLREELKRMRPWERFLASSISSIQIESGVYFASILSSMPNLSRLDIGLKDADFEPDDVTKKSPWTHDFTDVEIARNSEIQGMLEIRGLKELKIVWSVENKDPTIEEWDKFKAFKLQVARLLEDMVYQPRKHIEATKTPLSLEETLKKDRSTVQASGLDNITGTSKTKPEVLALTDDEVPVTQDRLLRTFLLHPEAMTKWVFEAKKKLEAVQ